MELFKEDVGIRGNISANCCCLLFVEGCKLHTLKEIKPWPKLGGEVISLLQSGLLQAFDLLIQY